MKCGWLLSLLACSLTCLADVPAKPAAPLKTKAKVEQALLVDPKPYVLPETPKRHVEEITAARQTYHIEMGGTLDEFNTPAYLVTYGGSTRLEPRFQPNKYLLLENAGETDIINPHVVINGRRNWYSADDLLSSILKPGMSDKDKATAIFAFLVSHEVQAHDNNRRPGSPFPDPASQPSRNTFKERAEPIRSINCFYCGGCSLIAGNYVILARHAGLDARAEWMCSLNSYANHCIAEVWYEGAWHMFDGDQRTYLLDRDNTTIASYETLHNNFDLANRTFDNGFATPKNHNYAEYYKKFYPPHVMPVDQWLCTMDMTLRPGEQFLWRWGNVGKFYVGDNVRNTGQVPYNLANAKLIYRPRLAGLGFWHGVLAGITIETVGTNEATACLQPMIPATKAQAVYKISSPYPIVGGLVSAQVRCRTAADSCAIYLSAHTNDWKLVWKSEGAGESHPLVSLDEALKPNQPPMLNDYYIKFELTGQEKPDDAQLSGICFESDLALSAMSLPSLSVGDNEVVYCDQSGAAGRKVRLTHGWTESSVSAPPQPPQQALEPAAGAALDMDAVKLLRWAASTDPDGKGIAEYHVQVSQRPDMLLPLCNNFDRITGSSKAEWAVPQGFFSHGRTYYWRVRARNAWGAWSRWSDVWTFTAK
jgi:hypothetical protein